MDGTVFIVPNETFMTQTIINHTLGSGGVCHTLVMEVAFGSDLHQVETILLATAQAQSRILTDPAPSVAVSKFTGHGVELSLQYWIADPGKSEVGLRSEMLLSVHRAFRAAGVAVPLRDGAQPVQL